MPNGDLDSNHDALLRGHWERWLTLPRVFGGSIEEGCLARSRHRIIVGVSGDEPEGAQRGRSPVPAGGLWPQRATGGEKGQLPGAVRRPVQECPCHHPHPLRRRLRLRARDTSCIKGLN